MIFKFDRKQIYHIEHKRFWAPIPFKQSDNQMISILKNKSFEDCKQTQLISKY